MKYLLLPLIFLTSCSAGESPIEENVYNVLLLDKKLGLALVEWKDEDSGCIYILGLRRDGEMALAPRYGNDGKVIGCSDG